MEPIPVCIFTLGVVNDSLLFPLSQRCENDRFLRTSQKGEQFAFQSPLSHNYVKMIDFSTPVKRVSNSLFFLKYDLLDLFATLVVVGALYENTYKTFSTKKRLLLRTEPKTDHHENSSTYNSHGETVKLSGI